jgi:hypothetical protein
MTDIFAWVEKYGSKWWGLLSLSVIPFLVVLFPLLFGDQVFAGHDTRLYPYFDFYKNAITSGESIWWNPYNYSGFPIAVSATGGFLSPLLYLIVKYAPALFAYHWLVFLNVVLGAFFMARLLKALEIPFWGSIVGGIVFAFSEWRWIDDITIVNAIPLLPLFFLLTLSFHKGKRKALLWLAIAVAYGIVTALFHYLLEGIFAAFLFAVFLAVFQSGAGAPWYTRKKNWYPILGYSVAVLVGVLLALPQVVPSLLYAGLSAGRAFIPHGEAVIEGLRGGDIMKLFFPYADVWFLPASPSTSYIGIFPLLFLFSAFVLKKNNVIKFFSVLFGLSVLLALNNSWLFWLLHHIPPFTLLHLSFRWMFIGWFAAAVLVGFAVGEIERGAKVPQARAIFRALLISAGGLFLLGVLAKLLILFRGVAILSYLKDYFRTHLYGSENLLPLSHYYNYIERLFGEAVALIDIARPEFFLSVMFIALTGFFGWYAMRRNMPLQTFVKSASVIAVLNLMLIWPVYARTLSQEAFLREPETAVFLANEPEGRTLTFIKGVTEFQKLHVPAGAKGATLEEGFILNRAMLFANTNMFSRIESAEIYEPLMSRRMARLVALLGSDLVWTEDKLSRSGAPPEELARTLSTRVPIASFLNIRYIVSAYPLDPAHFKKIFETAVTDYRIPLMIYENPAARPRFYFASPVSHIAEDELKAFELLKTMPASPRGVFIECSQEAQDVICTDKKVPGFDGKGTITVQTKKNTESVLKTTSNEPQLLIFSENNLPGWKAYIDGKETTLFTVGSVYIGVVISRGTHEVRFEFRYGTILEEGWSLIKPAW